jgi:hypothetical protein
LPDNTRMPLKVLRKISELVKAGATVIGPAPVEDSGLVNYPHCDAEIKILAKQLWRNIDGKNIKQNHYGAGRIIFGDTIRKVLMDKNIQPDFEYTGGEDVWLDFIHRSTPESEIYFVTNRHGKAVRSDCTFRVAAHAPEIWNAVTAKIDNKVNYKVVNGRIVIGMNFEAFQSFFIVFPKNSGLTTPLASSNFPELKLVQELTGTWDVAFDTKWGGPGSVEFHGLQDWSKSADDRIKHFSGKAIYTKNIDWNIDSKKPVYLDLGLVKNIADVWLNGKHLGIVWTAPWRIDISPAIKQGRNLLKIEVINLWPNRLIGDAALLPEKKLTNTNIAFKPDAPLLPSGLLGPVTILVEV